MEKNHMVNSISVQREKKTKKNSRYPQVNIDELKYHCFWCGNSKQRWSTTTYMEFDLDLHLWEKHKLDMVKLSIAGKGRNLNVRIAHAVEQCKTLTKLLRQDPVTFREKVFGEKTSVVSDNMNTDSSSSSSSGLGGGGGGGDTVV